MAKKLTKITDLAGYDGPREWLSPTRQLILDTVKVMKANANSDFSDAAEHRRTLTTIYLFANAKVLVDEADCLTISIKSIVSDGFELEETEKEKICRALAKVKGKVVELRVADE